MHARGAAAALVAALALAACGGSGGSSSSTSSRSAAITKAAFITRADVICKASQTALKPVLVRETATLEAKPPKRAAAAAALEQASAIVAHGLARLRALPQPAQRRSLLDTVYRALSQEAATLHLLAADVRAGKAKAMNTDASKQTAFARLYSGAATQFGFRHCGAAA